MKAIKKLQSKREINFKGPDIKDSSDDVSTTEEETLEKNYLSTRDSLYRLLTVPTFNIISLIYAFINLSAIFASTITFLLGTVATIPSDPLFDVEMIAVSIFSFDYVAKIILTRQNRLVFALEILNMIDLLAILPSYLELTLDSSGGIKGLIIVRILRLFRIFRMVKIAKYSKQLPVIISAVRKSSAGFLLGLFSITLFLVLWASAIYFVETAVCTFDPTDRLWKYEDGSPTFYQSIPHSLWWTVVTMCTVGYGDTYPRTHGGQAVAIVVMFCGVIVLAFPLTVLSGNFMSEWNGYLVEEERKNLHKMEKEFRKRKKKLARAVTEKEKKELLPPPPGVLLNEIWNEMLMLKNGIDASNTAIDNFEIQFRKIELIMEKLLDSVNDTEKEKFKLPMDDMREY